MKTSHYLEKIGTEAVHRMRRQKLRNGHPFMINSKDLVTNQCYLEYPNGCIKLVSMQKAARDFNIIRELSEFEAHSLRIRHQF